MTETALAASPEGPRLLIDTAQPQLRLLRTHEHLTEVPQLVGHIISLVTPSMQARTDDGSQRTKASFGGLPLRETPVDDADALYAQLANWATYFARTLNTHPPVHLLAGYDRDTDIAGLPAHALRVPQHAMLLTAAVARWLQDHEHQIATTEAAATYEQDVHELIARMHGRYPTAPPPQHRYFTRVCDICGEKAVRVHWADTDDTAHPDAILTLTCRNCRYVIPVTDLDRYLNSAW